MKSRTLCILSTLCLAASSSFSKPHPGSRLRLRQVLVVHRHGDRTPITPMKDEGYWRNELPEPNVLDGIARGTSLVRPPEGGPRKHGAVGRGPFGQLTLRGLLQMISLGELLREELGHSHHEEEADDGDHQPFVNRGRLFTPTKPLHPSRVRVMSTDFPRTIQSVQALLTGLFPDAADAPIEIDLQHTNSYFIPDPQPRQYKKQLALESHLSQRPHLAKKEDELRELAHRVTDALDGHLGKGAKGVSFGIGEEKDASSQTKTRQPLAWAQLAEILICLHSREMLPPALSEEDVQAVSNHVAWRWFENLRHPVLAKSAMWKFASRLVENMQRKAEEQHDYSDESNMEMMVEAYERDCAEEPWLCIYSAHDSTLIGLLCVLQLEQPAEWPEYGSALKVELIGEEEDGSHPTKASRHWVRFSLNGQVLRSTWLTDNNDEPATMVPLNDLADMIDSEHELFEEDGANDSGLKYSWKDGLLEEH
eukprot:CAMPEP_0172533924 /NCGR_PEP_ID=MMETSP1067-20121228/6470_1 /TAXON_ID=265564 ORGANISM="Thalassiosira punctigera, Strain Tpunct2005C2" /NCGR_SAMPLE_ID=MMETSP1067 /ASSEMBLY_ACC=CAM_ASM_000444 /LENGTH=478 /DNA_ID=CAMNT_0013318643 /DNA_START=23 /DNA_END=1459 /DNA_ORIENTATION=+